MEPNVSKNGSTVVEMCINGSREVCSIRASVAAAAASAEAASAAAPAAATKDDVNGKSTSRQLAQW